MIDSKDIILNIETRDSKYTSTGNLFVGGAFMGNNVVMDNNNNVKYVDAFQEINPVVLERADMYSKPGTFIMHEITECYNGALLSKKIKKSSPSSDKEGTMYKNAHNKATYQPAVLEKLYDIKGNITQDKKKAVKAEWYVADSQNNQYNLIQSIP